MILDLSVANSVTLNLPAFTTISLSTNSLTMSGNLAHGADPQRYSTNPNTIKARRRKMNLTGAQKHEDAARTADYKAMIYARKVAQEKPEYLAAPEKQKVELLERAMREAMEKR